MPTFSVAHKWAELLRNPCILRGSEAKGTKSELATSAVPSQGPTNGLNYYVTPAFSGVHSNGDKIRIGYLNPAVSCVPQMG